ncbi:nuclease-related domain-containing protein [Streptomyces sp. KL109B]|uniref:nuclease-related domain-containing protein n=2 Tax=unclassified Streptomyces TaxID=2593676 RepID=UPI00278BBC62|nr:nuclease-related domain-containing protein [Streptomyces sp. KL109B]
MTLGTLSGVVMGLLKVVRWKRHGHDRLYVNLPDGTAVAWMDCRTGKIEILDERYRREALGSLRVYRGSQPRHEKGRPAARTPSSRRPSAAPRPRDTRRKSLPALSPGEDLAANRPGARLLGLIAERGPTRAQRAWARLRGRSTEWDSWFAGLEGERRVGNELRRLENSGWRVLHGIPLPNGADIDHLLIGPGGVFAINTKHHDGKSVWVGDEMARIDHGPARPYARASKAEAQRVRAVLELYVDFDVPVEPAIVLVGAEDVARAPTQFTVRVYREREVSSLAPLDGVLAKDQVETLYEVARRRRVWLSG